MEFDELKEGMLVKVREHAGIETSLHEALKKANWVAKVIEVSERGLMGKYVKLNANGVYFETNTPQMDLNLYVPKSRSQVDVNISTDDIRSRLKSVGMKMIELKTHTGKGIVPTLEIKAYFLPELK